MKRSKRLTLRRIALGLAVAAVLAPAAQAEPMESESSRMSVAPAQVDFWNYDANGRKIADTSPGVAPDQLAQLWSGSDVALAPDDMALSRPSNVGTASVEATSGGYDVGPGTVGGFGVALVLLAGGSALALRHSRKTRLSPA